MKGENEGEKSDEKEEKNEETEKMLNTGKKELFTEEKRVKPEYIREILSVLAVSIGCFIHGTSFVWPIVLPKIISDSNSSLANVTGSGYTGYSVDPTTDVSWIVSILVFGNFLGGVISAPLSNTLGRKLTLMLGVGVIFGLSYILVLTAVQVSMLYLARVLMGIGLGISTSVSTVYIQDIASPNIRGSLGAIPSVAGALGVFSFQILNAFITWRQLNVLGATLSIPLILALSFLPESPVFLVSRQKLKAAEKALRALRGPNYDVQSELKSLQARQDEAGKSSKNRMSFAVLKDKEVLTRVFISWMLLILLNASGVGLVMSYTVQIFQSVNSSVDEFVATIYVGSALLASNFMTVLLAHKLPRRIMLMVSSLGISATLAILGLSYQLQDWEKQCIQLGEISADDCSYGNLGWLPLCTLMIYIFVFNLGLGAMIFITMSEILPPHAREIGMSLCIALSSPTAFIVQYSFPYLLQELKGQGVFWLYSSLSLAGFVFITCMIPETRGKTDQQIQEQMQSNQSDKLNQEPKLSNSDQKLVHRSPV